MMVEALTIPGAFRIKLSPVEDERGYFVREIDRDTFIEYGLNTQWEQESSSYSKYAYTIRGLHYQKEPAAETKLISVVKGRLFDVMVDLRSDSPSFGQWLGFELADSVQQMLYIPKGCAHGFCTLEPNTVIHYKIDCKYRPDLIGRLLYSDEQIGIQWPIPTGANVLISAQDQQAKQWNEKDF